LALKMEATYSCGTLINLQRTTLCYEYIPEGCEYLKSYIQILIGSPEEKRPLGREARVRDNIKVDL
jgi:hypothetical protein